MTATKVAQQLIHVALDVVAPLERFSYLSGVLDGYKLAREEVEGAAVSGAEQGRCAGAQQSVNRKEDET